MKPTRWLTLAAVAAVGVAVGWVAVLLVDRLAGRILVVPWLAAGALWVLALAVVLWTLLSRPSLVEPRRGGRRGEPLPVVTTTPRGAQRTGRPRIPPLVAARTAALAMAASRTGALIGGFYLGILLAIIPVVSTPSGSASASAALASVGACAVLVVSALWLESMCRLRNDDDR
ncbi:MAG: DUF3180 family protein [bacterium]